MGRNRKRGNRTLSTPQRVALVGLIERPGVSYWVALETAEALERKGYVTLHGVDHKGRPFCRLTLEGVEKARRIGKL